VDSRLCSSRLAQEGMRSNETGVVESARRRRKSKVKGRKSDHKMSLLNEPNDAAVDGDFDFRPSTLRREAAQTAAVVSLHPFLSVRRSLAWQRALLLVGCLVLLAVTGCRTSRWVVKPNEREYLADRIMRLDATPQEDAAEQHILTNREGAMGGSGTTGGG